jgi:hypothetical protein
MRRSSRAEKSVRKGTAASSAQILLALDGSEPRFQGNIHGSGSMAFGIGAEEKTARSDTMEKGSAFTAEPFEGVSA